MHHHAKKGPRGGDLGPSQELPALVDRGGAASKTKSPKTQRARGNRELALYDAACRALAEAVAVDEVKDIIDVAAAMQEYARRAKNFEMEANAVELRIRATHKLGKLIEAQKATVGLAQGTRGSKVRGVRVDDKPTLASQGIDKNLAHQSRTLGKLSPADLARKIADGRRSAGRVHPRIVREVEIEQERQERRAQTAKGGSVADLHKLIASGFRAGVIAVDPPWSFSQWSERANGAMTDHYEIMTFDAIKALPIAQLAAKDCAVFLWVTWPNMPEWKAVTDAWGATFSGLGFDWIKTNASGEGLHWGMGYGTRANPEPCLLAKIGKPLRLDEGVHSVIMTPVGAHSEKPDEAYRRMQRLYGGPYLELFARKPRAGWVTWGNELPPPDSSENWDQMWARPFDYTKLDGGASGPSKLEQVPKRSGASRNGPSI
jgi:N6-adenosine-specific RNA methylase IME4